MHVLCMYVCLLCLFKHTVHVCGCVLLITTVLVKFGLCVVLPFHTSSLYWHSASIPHLSLSISCWISGPNSTGTLWGAVLAPILVVLLVSGRGFLLHSCSVVVVGT